MRDAGSRRGGLPGGAQHAGGHATRLALTTSTGLASEGTAAGHDK